MSTQNVPDSAHHAASEQSSQQNTGKAAQHATTTAWQAPYHPAEDKKNAVPGYYIVKFHPGHTLAQHFVFLGCEFDLIALNEGYYANLDDKRLTDIRCDPGVEFVKDDVLRERDGPAPYYPTKDKNNAVPGGYIVQFYPGHTIAKHFAFLGREFDLTPLNEGYFAKEVDDQLLNAIRSDPGLEFVEDGVLGEPHDDVLGERGSPAPYYPTEDKNNAVPGGYIVRFYPGHTIAEHFAFLGRKFDLTPLSKGYFADEVDDKLFNAIRDDPGLEYIEDNVLGLAAEDDDALL